MIRKLYRAVTGSLIILLAAAYGIQYSFATGSFEVTSFKLEHDPTICANEPSDPSFPSLGEKMLTETQLAALDWNNKLNEGLGKHPVWKMNLVDVPFAKQNNYDYSKCDITISFKPKPPDIPASGELVGVTTYFNNHTANIEIYYRQVVYDKQVSTSKSGGYAYYTSTWTPRYADFLAADPQLRMAIRHELGHSFGLGHYDISDTEMQRWESGQEDLPSIMVKVIVPIGNNFFDITTVDVQQIKSLYGDNGFSSSNNSINVKDVTSNDKDNFKQWLVGQASKIDLYGNLLHITNGNYVKLPPSYKYSGHVQMPSWFKMNIMWWVDGKISDNEFFASMQYLLDKGILRL